jgi:hypothetical protein
MSTPEFTPFPKMARFSRDIIITEKLDGTNSSVCISQEGDYNSEFNLLPVEQSRELGLIMLAGSRNRWLTIKTDNYGFAGWCQRNKDELLKLGVGHHTGEWWGKGIARRYLVEEKIFSLFNVSRWYGDDRPVCCSVVPVLYSGAFDTREVDKVVNRLRTEGSVASPGFMKAEGIIIWHTAGNFGMKKTLEHDELHKFQVKETL